MARTAALILLAALVAAPYAGAQPAPNANPRAFKGGLTPECQRLRDEYLRAAEAARGARVGAANEDARVRGGNADLKALRQNFEAKCGALPAEMTPKPGDDEPKADDRRGNVGDRLQERVVDDRKDGERKGDVGDKLQDRVTGDRERKKDDPVDTRKEIAQQNGVDLPKKAGMTTGGGSDATRCAQLLKGMKDSLARKDACGKDRECRKLADAGYERSRNAYMSGCGEVPDEAKPRKR